MRTRVRELTLNMCQGADFTYAHMGQVDICAAHMGQGADIKAPFTRFRVQGEGFRISAPLTRPARVSPPPPLPPPPPPPPPPAPAPAPPPGHSGPQARCFAAAAADGDVAGDVFLEFCTYRSSYSTSCEGRAVGFRVASFGTCCKDMYSI